MHQKRALGFLSGILESGNVGHALVFTGDAGLGKRRAALHFAMALNCGRTSAPENALFGEQGPCGACKSCRKTLSSNHPDVIFIEKSGAWIKIGQIRSLLDVLAVKPAEGRMRVVVIADAGAMNIEASNSLLKALEEPPDRTCFILLAGQKSELASTIASRCQEIRFAPAPVSAVEGHLQAKGLEQSLARACAMLSQGSFSRADELSDEKALARRSWLVNQLCALEDKGPVHALAMAEFLAKDKESAGADLAWIRTWLRDLLVSSYSEKHVINQDFLGLITSRARKSGPENILNKINAVFLCERDLARNVNTRLALEAMCLRLASGG